MGTAGYAKGWKCTDFFETFGNGGGSYERGREGFVGFLRVGRFVHIPGKMLWLGEQGGAGVDGSVVRGVETVLAGDVYQTGIGPLSYLFHGRLGFKTWLSTSHIYVLSLQAKLTEQRSNPPPTQSPSIRSPILPLPSPYPGPNPHITPNISK